MSYLQGENVLYNKARLISIDETNQQPELSLHVVSIREKNRIQADF